MGQIEVSSRLGKIIIDKSKIIYFPRGLIGFEGYHYFVLLQIKDKSPFLLLQSTENSRLGLIVADPFVFVPHFRFSLNKIEEKVLRISGRDEISVLATVNIPAGKPENTTLNLSGPIVINNKSKRGLQLAVIEAGLPSHVVISEFVQERT
ncbi:flagellar assembly factor FliW [Desulfonauticus submarinus]|uniref:Flagellar assembly factor FliW n=1 Tax=Desulfonauticus submarinus TaxID=206665 RepID=A0A1H0AJ76_9BACT|nr:flagellar assembly protein FliW [Desulfonauticus submarinus]SDN33632.1 flagellar assembly factor FliW [Desulfonauticus submarinus]